MNLQDMFDIRVSILIGPTRFKYDLDYILTRIPVDELRNGVFDGLVLFEKLGFVENLAATRAREDVVSEWQERVLERNIGLLYRPSCSLTWRKRNEKFGL